MPRKNIAFNISLLYLCLKIVLSCSTDQVPSVIESSMPQSELAYYCDPFDSLKEDLWDKAGHVFSAAQLKNIKMGDLTIDAGRLRIDTKTGGFSKGGLVSKFALRGNFDVQIDFQIEFVAGALDMDQVLGFGVVEKSKSGKANRLILIVLHKKEQQKSRIISGYRQRGRYHAGFSQQIDNFKGSVRMVRTGNQVRTFFRKERQNRWTKMCDLPSSQGDALIGFTLANFVVDRKTIVANRSVSAWVDNFKITAAQEILETEI